MLSSRIVQCFAAVALVVLAACDGSRGGRGSTATGRDGSRELALEVVARLDDRGQPILARPELTSVDSRGRYFITDRSDKNVKVYDAEGRRTLTFGRAGGGPGEFQSLITAQIYRDSLVVHDFLNPRGTVFGPDGRYARALSLVTRGMPVPRHVRVVDDSLFLLVAPVPGNADRDLVTLVRPDGSKVSSFFNQASYFRNDPNLIQHTGVIADAANGLVFVALVGGDSVWAFDYTGRRVATHPIDPVQPLVTLKTLLARNGGKPQRPDGTWVMHDTRRVIKLVALDSATVAMQVAPYDTKHGIDPLDGGTLLVVGVASEGAMRTLSRHDLVGALVGRDRDGRPLLLRYASPDGDSYELIRGKLVGAAIAARQP